MSMRASSWRASCVMMQMWTNINVSRASAPLQPCQQAYHPLGKGENVCALLGQPSLLLLPRLRELLQRCRFYTSAKPGAHQPTSTQ